MFDFKNFEYDSKEEFYENLLMMIEGLIREEHDLIANLANISSLCYSFFKDINWFGFYLYKEEQLVLGPFHGKPACVRIQLSSGVCGAAASKKEIQIVPNVHEFEGHIPCDGDTNSEIVLPMIAHHQLIGVLDIDSPKLNRFDEIDGMYLSKVVEMIMYQLV